MSDMSDGPASRSGLQVRSGPMITGASLAGAGLMLVAAGVVVGGLHLLSATRQWIAELEVPPSELAKIKWAQAKAAAMAGSSAWQEASANGSQRTQATA